MSLFFLCLLTRIWHSCADLVFSTFHIVSIKFLQFGDFLRHSNPWIVVCKVLSSVGFSMFRQVQATLEPEKAPRNSTDGISYIYLWRFMVFPTQYINVYLIHVTSVLFLYRKFPHTTTLPTLYLHQTILF